MASLLHPTHWKPGRRTLKKEGEMGMLGRYIDALPDQARDRIIEAQRWGMGALVDAHGNRCLIGHAEDWRYAGSLFRNSAGDASLQRWRVENLGSTSHLEIGKRFDMLCHRFGQLRAVRLAKMRAGVGSWKFQVPGSKFQVPRAQYPVHSPGLAV